MKKGDSVRVFEANCTVVGIHGGPQQLLTVVYPSNPPKILVGVPRDVEGKPREAHGAAWTEVTENPITVLCPVPPERAERTAADEIESVVAAFDLLSALEVRVAALRRSVEDLREPAREDDPAELQTR